MRMQMSQKQHKDCIFKQNFISLDKRQNNLFNA